MISCVETCAYAHFNQGGCMQIGKILTAFLFLSIFVFPLKNLEAAPMNTITGSWCLDISRNGVTRPAVINFSSDGNMTTIPGTPFPSASIPDATDRSPGIGEVTKVGANKWEANFQIFLYKTGAPISNYNGRQVIRLPIQLGTDGTISDGGATFSITVLDKNDNFIETINGTYEGRRTDPSTDTLCDFNINPPIP